MSDSTSGYTVEKLKLLEDAIADGIRRVKYTDKEIEYRSLAEMKQIARDMRNALGLNQTKRSKGKGLFGGKRIVGRHSKGLED